MPRAWALWGLAALILVSLGVRLPYLSTERLWPDEALYAWIARGFLADPATLFRPEAFGEHLPIVPVLLSVGMLLWDGPAGLRAVALAVNLLGILATYRLGERIAGRFTGLSAALFLAVNVGYLHHSHLVLIDGAFAVAHVGLALALLNVRAEPAWDRRDLVAGLAATGVAAMKWYAALMIAPVVVVYYLVACRGLTLGRRLRKVLLPAACLGAFAVPYLMWKLDALDGFGGIVAYFQRPATYYLQTALGFVGGPIALAGVLVGGYFLVRQAPRIRALIASVVVVELVVMSLAPEKDGRYILPVLPFLGVLFGLGIGGLLDRMVTGRAARAGAQGAAIALLSLQFVPFVLHKDRTPMNVTYTGFLEGGKAVRDLDQPGALVLAGSVRAVRYAAGRGQEDRVQGLPSTVAGLRAIMERHRGRLILETDRWEYTQPPWIFPWSDARIESLEAMGFRRAALIRRPVAGQLQPVVLVLVRD